MQRTKASGYNAVVGSLSIFDQLSSIMTPRQGRQTMNGKIDKASKANNASSTIPFVGLISRFRRSPEYAEEVIFPEDFHSRTS